MDINKIKNDAAHSWNAYKKSDPVMVRKSFQMKDVIYRKSSPGRELWHTEFSFDYDFYALIIAAVLVIIAFCAFAHRIKKKLCRVGKRRK